MIDHATDHPADDSEPLVQEPRLWQGNGWTAKVIKNEDDEGWAVAMIKDGEPEPALVGPWTMGRDKKNPKPLDTNAFHTLVKTASEVLRRHEQQLHAMLHKSTVVTVGGAEIKVTLDIVPDEDHPYALLTAIDESGEKMAQVRTAANYKLTPSGAADWVENGFRKPA
ncbi:hypothetical protein [Massilia sp. CF038]|uniref:hypothetical protein n=1 Tax=Massilia sp. CF038 TaxID=1881045 RepID=UPI000934043F|nr:hypothetical protein [Massilia sp. CF038]